MEAVLDADDQVAEAAKQAAWGCVGAIERAVRRSTDDARVILIHTPVALLVPWQAKALSCTWRRIRAMATCQARRWPWLLFECARWANAAIAAGSGISRVAGAIVSCAARRSRIRVGGAGVTSLGRVCG